MKWIVKIFLNGIALIIVAQLISGIEIKGFTAALIAAVILGLVNTFIRPILLLLTLPITFFTLGLFILVINALTFAFTAWIVEGFYVYSFWGAFFGALLTSLFSWILNGISKEK